MTKLIAAFSNYVNTPKCILELCSQLLIVTYPVCCRISSVIIRIRAQVGRSTVRIPIKAGHFYLLLKVKKAVVSTNIIKESIKILFPKSNEGVT